MNTPQLGESLDNIKRVIEKAGVVGAGGGGFPAHLKLDSRCKTILLNCAECEPLLQVDQLLLTHFTKEILHTLNLLAEILNANVIVAVKKSYTAAVSAVRQNLPLQMHEYSTIYSDEARVSNGLPRVTLCELGDFYPAGDEIVLIYEATGTVIPPGSLPIESGFVVFNVETVYNMRCALEYGQSVTHKWVTITGEVQNPTTVSIPIGTTVEEAVEIAGGATVGNPSYITGAMMGGVVPSSFEITKTTGGIIVLPAGHALVRKPCTNAVALNRVASACCQCRTCTDMCPRALLGHPIQPHRIMRALSARNANDSATHGIMHCSACGVCETIACPQSLAPRTLIKQFKSALTKGGVTAEKCTAVVSPARRGRMVDATRLKIRLGLQKYDNHTSLFQKAKPGIKEGAAT